MRHVRNKGVLSIGSVRYLGMCLAIFLSLNSLLTAQESSLLRVEESGNSYSLVAKAGGTIVLQTAGSGGNRSFTFESDGVLKVQMSGFGTETFNDNGEHYYGVWEKVCDTARHFFDNRGYFAGKYNDRGDNCIINGSGIENFAPYYMTDKGYAIYAPGNSSMDFRSGGAIVEPENDFYYVIYGPSYREMFQRYRDLAGAPYMPPIWSFGVFGWQDDIHFDGQQYHDINNYRNQKVHYTVYWADNPAVWPDETWKRDWPNAPAFIDSAQRMGYRMLVWTMPEFHQNSYLGNLMQGHESLTSAEDEAKLKQYLRNNVGINFGIQGFKIDREVDHDFTERFYRVSRDALQEKFGDDWFVFARGAHDICRQWAGVWNGDARKWFPGYTLTIKHALRSGAIMFPMWGSDCGGYGYPTGGRAGDNWKNLDTDFTCRWFAHSAYSPIMEIPGSGPDGGNTPNYEIGVEFCRIHHYLIPYNRSMMYQAHLTGYPVMAAMIFFFPDDNRFIDTWEQYMFGSEILAAPVVVENARNK